MTPHSLNFFLHFIQLHETFFFLTRCCKNLFDRENFTIKAFRIGFAWTMDRWLRKKISSKKKSRKGNFNNKKSFDSRRSVASRCKLRFLQSLSHDEQFSARRLTHIQTACLGSNGGGSTFSINIIKSLDYLALCIHLASSNSTKLRRMLDRAKRH